jgi:hypothetical protein
VRRDAKGCCWCRRLPGPPAVSISSNARPSRGGGGNGGQRAFRQSDVAFRVDPAGGRADARPGTGAIRWCA